VCVFQGPERHYAIVIADHEVYVPANRKKALLPYIGNDMHYRKGSELYVNLYYCAVQNRWVVYKHQNMIRHIPHMLFKDNSNAVSRARLFYPIVPPFSTSSE